MCEKHGKPKIGLCSWCGRTVCDECVTEAYGKNYCFTCLAKLPLDKLESLNSASPVKGVKNIDPTLTHEEAEEKREFVQLKMSSDKDILNGIKNIDDKTEQVDDIRKKYEAYRKMKEKFGL